MIEVEIEKTVDRPIEEVFERLVDIPGYREWMPRTGLFVTCIQDSEGPAAAGTAYTDVTRLGTIHGEIAEFERPRRVVFHYTWKVWCATWPEDGSKACSRCCVRSSRGSPRVSGAAPSKP